MDTKHTKIETLKTYKRYKYMVIATDMGHRCGYVKIPTSHYLYGKSYHQNLTKVPSKTLKTLKVGKRGSIPLFLMALSKKKKITMDILFNVHGSITFSGRFRDKRQKGFWIGFDCAHSGDKRDPTIMSEKYINIFANLDSSPYFRNDILWTNKDVIAECKSLIRQVIKYFDK